VLDAVGEYIRISLVAANEDAYFPAPQKIIVLLRLLFPGVRDDYVAPPDLCVLYETPLLIVQMGGRTGSYGILPDHLDPFRRHGKLRKRPLFPGQRPWRLLDNPALQRLLQREDRHGGQAGSYGLRLQVLRLLAPALRLHRTTLQVGSPEGELLERWRAAVARGERLRLIWDQRKQAYVPSAR
jgi:hypothetical protein